MLYQYATPTSWNWSGAQLVIFNNVGGIWPMAEDGQQYVDIGNIANYTSLYQNFTVTAGGLYQFTWYNNTASGNPDPSPYSIDVLNSSQTSVGNASFDANTGGNWAGQTFSLNLTPDTYTLSFASQGSLYDTLLDNVSVTSSTSQVPEPATFALMSLGLAGMCFDKRRKLT